MSRTSPSLGKEKGRVIGNSIIYSALKSLLTRIDLTTGNLESNSSPNLSVDNNSDLSDAESDVVTPEYLESLLEKARKNYAAAAAAHKDTHGGVDLEEQIINLDGEEPYVHICNLMRYLTRYDPDLYPR
jgi:hypothetical protein